MDDRREDFTREELTQFFSLERVNKSPASFDPAKLLAFQNRYMQQLPIKQKTAAVLPYLQQAGLDSQSAPLRHRAAAAADSGGGWRPAHDGRGHPGLRLFLRVG